MSQHLGILQPPPLSSAPKPDSLSRRLSFGGFKFGLHSSVSWPISLSCACARQTPSLRLSEQEEGPASASVHLRPISSEIHFDRVLAQAQTLHHPVVIVWMANWCRKCIYLKPKLEKLAADCYPSIWEKSYHVYVMNEELKRAGKERFYCIGRKEQGIEEKYLFQEFPLHKGFLFSQGANA